MNDNGTITRRNLLKNGHLPDILDTIANLSNDEVFTPPELVNKILDLFPEEIWKNKDLKWLDPATKTGIFLREIATRLMKGLRAEFPDEEERRQHIFKNMLYGIAITDLTALMSRRSLYTSKYANGKKSIAKFKDKNGNIFYDNRPHTYKNGACIYCGNKEGGELDRDESRERHAYNFIHLTKEEAEKMHFDVIVGNPPYQLGDGGFGASASPIYQLFIEQAKKLKPRYMAFIIPSRWFAGGKGLDQFRNDMLHDHHIKSLYDYPDPNDCFPGIPLEGGVNYFIWDEEYNGPCKITTVVGEESSKTVARYLDEYDIFIRWNDALPILRKVKSKNEPTLDNKVSSRKPFGLASNFKSFDEIDNPDKYPIYANKAKGYVLKTQVQSGLKMVDKYKVFVVNAYGGGSNFPNNVTVRPIVGEPNSVCTETYMVAGSYDNETEAKNMAKYIETRFFRFLLLLRKSSQHMPKNTYAFVPDLPMDQEWTDEKLYKRYDITKKEQEFIESLVKEM